MKTLTVKLMQISGKAVLFLWFAACFTTVVSAQSADPPATIGNINTVFENTLSAIIVLIGVASLGMLIMGGYRYLSAGSDKKAAILAQQTISFAIGGLIVALCSWLILSFIGNALGINLNSFDICITPGC